MAAQFGVANKKKGSTFEELNELAKGQLGDNNLMDELANLSEEDIQKMIQETMNDPELMRTMEQVNSGVSQVMEELNKMSPDELKQHMTEGLAQLTSPDMVETIMGNKDEVLKSLAEQGLVTAEKIAEYEADPAKFEEEMANAFAEMKKIFENPETLDAATKMMEGFTNILKNPEEAMKNMAQTFSEELGDDDKIEEARLQLLADPDKAGNPALASMFQNEEMKEILNDPVKWREQVKKGQDMLLGGDGTGAGMGEL